jgi:sorbitol/mannitol transport system substrate-binding protein
MRPSKMTDRAADVNGICLRGKAGWGENMAFLTAMSNSFGARWFDENWKPQFDQPEWKNTLETYVNVMKEAGPVGASSNGFNENLALFQQGKCGMWIDATVAASFVSDPKARPSPTRSATRWRPTPVSASAATGCGHGRSAFRPARRRPKPPEVRLLGDLQGYLDLVASKEGWANVPPGTRTSLYNNPEYQKAAPFAKMTLDSINSADPTIRRSSRCPMSACSSSPSLSSQGLGTNVGQLFSAALAGQMSIDDALSQAQDGATQEMAMAGYIKVGSSRASAVRKRRAAFPRRQALTLPNRRTAGSAVAFTGC